jgi:tetratricopeptide (TPR) repeat protein
MAPPSDTPTRTGPATHLFTTAELIAALAAFLGAGGIYLYYMSPSVTLQDSGELVTGAFNFGVPHPTGYPTWAFLGWVWSQLVAFGNPAWRLCLFSVVTGAALVGIMTLLMSRSILMLLRSSPWGEGLAERHKEWLGLACATAATLMYAFNRGVWQWACVPEMRVLNAFSFMATTCILFAWVMRPQQHRYLYALLLVWGLSLANHQTIIVMFAPFLAGMWVVGYLTDDQSNKQRYAGLLEFLFALLVAWTAGVLVNAWLVAGPNESLWAQRVKMLLLFGPQGPPGLIILLSGGSAAALMATGLNAGAMCWKRAAICAAIFVLALSMYAYMPLASSTNPPMNWGYAATKQGFLHSITRGQYEQLRLSLPTSEKYWIQVGLFLKSMLGQYSWPVGLFALVPLGVLLAQWPQLKARARQWMVFSLVAFLITSFGLIVIINPDIDKTQQEINLKFFAPAHGFFAILIGYGLALSLAGLLARYKNLAHTPVCLGSWLLLALAIIPFRSNWAICEQRGHDFGYQFGYRMFYPGGDYPPMEKDAVLFGGTDPGRFVPTYMIFCESRVSGPNKFRHPDFNRSDVYIITQNALADTTYMSYIRDHYDFSRPTNYNVFARWLGRPETYPVNPIWIPTENDSRKAFEEYVADVQARMSRGEQLDADEQVDIVGGRVQVRGVKGVMNINGILCKWIHNRNKAQHAFYVEESYVIPWMYPYFEPFGIILKLNAEPLPAPQDNPPLWSQIISRDRKYWDELVAEFTARPEFWRDSDARKTFSKLRSAIGGLYAYRRLLSEAEYAYSQSLKLCPDSPEANFRYAQLLLETGKGDQAVEVLEAYQKLDPLNAKIRAAVEQIRNIKNQSSLLQQLEQRRQTEPTNFQLVAQLAQAYHQLRQNDKLPGLFESYLSHPGVPSGDYLQIAQFYITTGQAPLAIRTVETARQRFPQDGELHYVAGILYGATGRPGDAIHALQRALAINAALRERARGDQRFGPLRNDPRFQALVAP